ncbi:MAG: Lpg1974 family pore-forming outer membrane protein [Planctomycetota bacterium]
MTILLRGACALLLAAGLAGTANAQTGGKVGLAMFEGLTETTTPAETQAEPVQQVSCNDCGVVDYGEYGACSGPACDLGCGVGSPLAYGRWFAGGEWLNVRANFSEATAARTLTTFPPPVTETIEQFSFDYGDSYRIFGGYQLPECGCEIRFTYTNFSSNGSFDSGPAPDPLDGTQLFPAFEIAVGPGESLIGTADVSIDNYDIGVTKTIPLGCLQSACGCGDCADCCDPCGCGPVCAAWDITFTGGIRVANVDTDMSLFSVIDPNNTPGVDTAVSRTSFDGVGLRFGVGGRRYFGRTGTISAYVRGDLSLLLGEVDYSLQASAINNVNFTSTQVVPVTEIEAGLTGYLTQNVSVSAGYLLSAWHDLGHRPEHDFSATGTAIQSLDDANLLTFDGFFLRAMAAY